MRSPEATGRLAWLILGIATGCFVLLCSLAGYGLWRFRATMLVPQTNNSLEAYAALVSRVPIGEVRPIVVPLEQPLPIAEGDTITVADSAPAGVAALVTLWDGSTLHLYAGAEVSFHRLRATRYSSQRQEVELEIAAGQVVLGVARIQRYQQVDIRVRTPAGTVLPQPDGTYLFRVGEQAEVAVLRQGRLQVVNGGGTPMIVGVGHKVVLEPNHTIVLELARWELLHNGRFDRGMEGWTFRSDQAGDGGTVDATVYREQQVVGHELAWAVGLERRGGIQDRCLAILSQEVRQDLSPYRSVQLEFDLRLNYQSLSGGGPLGVDYPFMVRIRYQDTDGRNREYLYGFYYRTEEGFSTELTGGETYLFPHYSWEHVSLELLDLRPLPVLLNGVDLLASGHDFTSWVANLSLTAE